MTKIYIDENFAPQLAKGFDIFQQQLNKTEKAKFKILSIKEEFGEGALDEDWIPQVGKEGGILITQDLRIQTTRHQYELYKKHGLGVFFFKPPSNGYTFWDMLVQLIKRWPDLKKKCKNKKPFAFRCTNNSTFKSLN